MAIATQHTDSITGSFSASTLLTKIDSILTIYTGQSDGTCKYTKYDNYTSTDYYGNQKIVNVYQVNFNLNDPNQPYYMTFSIASNGNSTNMYFEWFTGWNKTTHIGQGTSEPINLSYFLLNQEIDFYNYYSKEMNFLYLQQSSNIGLIGWMKPEFPRPWVTTLVGFPTDYTAGYFKTVDPNPYGSGSNNYFTNLNSGYLSKPNPNNRNRRDALAGIIWFDQNGYGTPGKTSDDIITGAFSGLSTFSTDTDDITGYTYVCLNADNGGLGVRIN